MNARTEYWTVDAARLVAAYEKVRLDLLAQRESAGHWIGELSTSALSTATAVSALALVKRRAPTDTQTGRQCEQGQQTDLSRRILDGIRWLAEHQNADGGWGDTEKSYSNISTTMLAVAAFHLTGVPARHANLLERAEGYIQAQGGVSGLRKRYGRDKTFAAPILANSALAGLVAWSEVPALPFELACLPQSVYRFLRLPVVSYAIPALVAIGQVRYHHRPPFDPLRCRIRAASVEKSLAVLQRMQPASGGYLEAVPLTSFVVMSLADIGRSQHPVAELGTRFLLSSARADGSWPIDTNLATWNTTLALNALASGGEDIVQLGCLDWLLACQHRGVHSFTGAAPGGWGWSDLSGAVPDADDTPGALLTLRHAYDSASCGAGDRSRVLAAARDGVAWLRELQNGDGGWPTFCRGWGALPFDRSGADLTAHALRALSAWRRPLAERDDVPDRALQRGFDYLQRTQRQDGSWIPLWFGNQDHPQEENPVYGTAKVLLCYRDLGRIETAPAQRGLAWLAAAQNDDGGWGGGPHPGPQGAVWQSSVEESALAVEGLLAAPRDPQVRPALEKGLRWLLERVAAGGHQETTPIGFYFAKLWYYERLYPLSFTASALGHAIQAILPGAANCRSPAQLPHA